MIKDELRRENEAWRHTRLIVAAFTGQDPRQIIQLPGDYDDVPITNEENANNLAEIWAKQLKELKEKRDGRESKIRR